MMYVRHLTCTLIINIHMYIQVERAYQCDVCQRSNPVHYTCTHRWRRHTNVMYVRDLILYTNNKHTHVHTGGEGIPV